MFGSANLSLNLLQEKKRRLVSINSSPPSFFPPHTTSILPPRPLTTMLTSLITLATLTAQAVLASPTTATNASDECRQLDAGKAPAPFPNTPPSFLNFAYYGQTAENATHPLNYERFMVAGHASLRDDEMYVTYEEMETYDAGACARRCDEEKTCASCESSTP